MKWFYYMIVPILGICNLNCSIAMKRLRYETLEYQLLKTDTLCKMSHDNLTKILESITRIKNERTNNINSLQVCLETLDPLGRIYQESQTTNNENSIYKKAIEEARNSVLEGLKNLESYLSVENFVDYKSVLYYAYHINPEYISKHIESIIKEYYSCEDLKKAIQNMENELEDEGGY